MTNQAFDRFTQATKPSPVLSVDARQSLLVPRMASNLATSPFKLTDTASCRYFLERDFAVADVDSFLSDAITEALLIHARAL